jgi:hypothetical protein
MKIYKVMAEELTYDRGIPTGRYTVYGYYKNKERAEEIAKANPHTMVTTDAEIEVIEVEE